MTRERMKTPDWRSRATFNEYQKEIAKGHLEHGCRLCEEISLTEYTHWRLITNRFPYDRVADVHHQLIPKRHTNGEDLTEEEERELKELKQSVLNQLDYNYIMQSLPKQMSIPAHLHYHLLKVKTFADVDV